MEKKMESKKKLNIAMLGHKQIPSKEGGVEVVVEELSTRMVKAGHKVTCFNRKGHNAAGAKFDNQRCDEYKGIRCIEVLTIDHKGLAAVSSSFFGAVHAAFGPYDVVHFHAEGPAFMCWVPRLFGKRIVVTIHGLDHQRAKWGRIASLYILQGEKNAVRFADEIIVLSASAKDYFMNKYGRMTRLIPNGVNNLVQREANRITKEYGLTKDEYILYLGRLVPEKGIHYLIEAYKKTDTDKKLVIAGGGSDTNRYVKHLKELAGDNPNIIFTGFVQGDILEEFYSNCYIYCLPSDLEGMPLSLLEAMRSGNCCLVSDIEECMQVIGDYGISFRKGNVEELAEKIQKLCDEAEWVEFYRRNVSDYVKNRHDWDRITEKTLELYYPRHR